MAIEVRRSNVIRRRFEVQSPIASEVIPQQAQAPVQDSFSMVGSQNLNGAMAPWMYVPPPSSRDGRVCQGYSACSVLGRIAGGLLGKFKDMILGALGRVRNDLGFVMNDPNLSVEDKVTLMLMQIMKKMDKEIEMQGLKIQAIQMQQGITKAASGAASMIPMFGGAGQVVGGLAEAASPSIDVETMKLKRLIDKRSQMFDMLRQIIDKYNQTAKNIIDSQSR
jgi:hypothetical protein